MSAIVKGFRGNSVMLIRSFSKCPVKEKFVGAGSGVAIHLVAESRGISVGRRLLRGHMHST